MNMAWNAGTPVLALLLLLSGCATAPKMEEPVQTCHGTVTLVVRNHTDSHVEVVESRSGSGSRTVIAIVGPGSHEVTIRNETGYYYSARIVGGSNSVAAESRPRVRDRGITLQRICREEP
jgi:hypothetical protein